MHVQTKHFVNIKIVRGCAKKFLKTRTGNENTGSRIEVKLNQEKVDFDTYEKGLEYKRKVALESVSTENEMRELIELSMTMKFFKNVFADKEVQTP